MGIYSDPSLLDWFVNEYPKHSKQKLDMGKSCVRFKKFDEIPYKLIGELMQKISVEKWINILRNEPKKIVQRTANITYTQAGVSCFVGQVSAKFEVQYFVGSLVLKIPSCV